MKVLENNYNTEKEIEMPYPRELICENCGSKLQYEESDLHMGEYGCMHITCPLCDCDNMLDDNENNIMLTVNNIEFPIHFNHTSKESGAKDTCNADNVKKEIQRAINYFRTNKNENEYSFSTSYGNLYINVMKFDEDEEYHITVSNNFYEMDINFEKEDY